MFAKKTKREASTTITQPRSSIGSNESLQTTRCPDGSMLVNGKCVCPNGSSLSHGKCPSPTPTPLPGSLTFLSVSTKVINNNAGTKNPSDFTITVSGNSPSPSSFSGSSSGTSVTLRSGSYKVTEDSIPGYTASYSSGCSGTASGGVPIKCTITNVYQPIPTMAKLMVSKKVINNGIGDKNPSDFTITVSGNSPSPNTFPGNSREGGTTVSLKPGSYKVTETGPSGYTSSFSSDCSGQINAGQDKACIITNEAKKFPPPTPLIVSTIKGFSSPLGLTYNLANKHIYVTNYGKNVLAGKVSIIDSSTNTVVDTIPVDKKPQAIAYNPANDHIYVANTISNTVSVINTLRDNVVATIPVGTGPNGVAYDSANDKIYITNTFSNNLSVIDVSKNNVIATIPVGTHPYGIVYDPDNHDIYVANYGSETVSVIHP